MTQVTTRASTPQPWASGRRRLVLGAGMLVYPGITAATIHLYSSGTAAVLGYVVVAAFSVSYAAAMLLLRRGARAFFWVFFGVMAILFVAELPFAQVDAFYLGAVVISIAVLPLRTRAIPLIFVGVAGALALPLVLPGWKDGPGWIQAVMIVFTALLWYAFAEIARSNESLVETRAEVARLASEAERNRIARDLHDLVGHSLTAITVKSNLARQLAAGENSPALKEITEVEQLSRQALADVRAAVSGYREVTLAGELARARELLRAADIGFDIPTAAEPSDAATQELFGWVVREGVTNVVRHSHATHCSITVSPSSISITDDGVGRASREGNGLAGLRERAVARGATLRAEALRPHGWMLSVTVDGTAS